MCSGSEAGSYLRLIDFVYHSTLGLRIIKKKKSHGAADGVPTPDTRERAREREGGRARETSP